MPTIMTLDPANTIKEQQASFQSGPQTVANTYALFFTGIVSAIPSSDEYRQIFLDAGRDPEFVEHLVSGLSKSSLYDSQTD